MAFGLGSGGRAGGDAAETPIVSTHGRPKLGLALGCGCSRGWAHIGVLQAFQEHGIRFDVVVGTSIGAVVGGCFVADRLVAIQDFALSLTRRRVMGLLDFQIGGSGLVAGDRLRRLLEHDIGHTAIEAMPTRFAAIATEIGSGHEVWLSRGLLVEAMRASYALPGIFDPVKVGGRWLMDGAMVNPIPVTTARALGAEIVVAVNLNNDASGRGIVIQGHGTDEEDRVVGPAIDDIERSMFAPVRAAAARINPFARRPVGSPRMASVMMDAFNVTQDRIARSRLAGDPPDVMLAPRLSRIGLFEFHRAAEAIAAGREAAERAIPELLAVLGEPAVAA